MALAWPRQGRLWRELSYPTTAARELVCAVVGRKQRACLPLILRLAEGATASGKIGGSLMASLSSAAQGAGDDSASAAACRAPLLSIALRAAKRLAQTAALSEAQSAALKTLILRRPLDDRIRAAAEVYIWGCVRVLGERIVAFECGCLVCEVYCAVWCARA